MLTFSSKFVVPFSQDVFAAVTAETLGATVHPDGKTFEVCTDSAIEGGELVPFSDKLAFRLTAKTDAERWDWLLRISEVLVDEQGSLPEVVFGQRGYWQPTGEFEDSWLVKTSLDRPTPALFDVIYQWMAACDQQAVYLEYGGQVFILDFEDVPANVPV